MGTQQKGTQRGHNPSESTIPNRYNIGTTILGICQIRVIPLITVYGQYRGILDENQF